jgi:UDP-N-acetyl-D-glucosamine dehydrogenase
MKNKICVIGQGFVGSVMSIACSLNNKFRVFGIEKNDIAGNEICKKMNKGIPPFDCLDKNLLKNFIKIKKQKNFVATTDLNTLNDSKIIIVSIGLNILKNNLKELNNFKSLIKDIATRIMPNALLLIECTLPTGFTKNIIIPILKSNLEKRKLNLDDILIAYSYERIMPGKNYFNSLVKTRRVFAGINDKSENACKNFFSQIMNLKKYPLQKLNSIEECETAKLLENSYRALNIAFIDDWLKFSKIAKLNIHDIINVIKIRPSHSNIMRPGLGVGGYCLTKDPLFINYSLKEFYNKKIDFKLNKYAVEINKNMPNSSAELIKSQINNTRYDKKVQILLAGITYREDVADLRNSPTATLYNILKKNKFKISYSDPYFKKWKIGNQLLKNINFTKKNKHIDLIVFCVAHTEYKKINFNSAEFLNRNKIIIDLNNCISENQIKKIKLNKYLKFIKLGSYND